MDYFHIALPADQLRTVSSIGLAHVGDGVYELLVRTWLCAHGKATGKDLHRAAIALVCAPEQAHRAQRILPLLTPEEDAVFKRGRNAAVHGIPKTPPPLSIIRPQRWNACWGGCTCGATPSVSTNCSP